MLELIAEGLPSWDNNFCKAVTHEMEGKGSYLRAASQWLCMTQCMASTAL